MAITISNIEECSVPVTTDYFTTLPSYISDTRLLFSTLGIDLFDKCESSGSWYTMLETDIMRVDAYCADKSEWNGYMSNIRFIDKRISSSSIAWSLNIGNLRHCYLALGFDDDTQTAYFLIAGQFYYRDGDWAAVSSSYYGAFPSNIRQQMYELVSGSQIQEHAWQSLEYVAGKSGYYGLTQLYDNTDGQPVSDAEAIKFFTMPDKSILNNIVEKVFGYEQIAMYTGDTHYVTIEWNNDTSFTMRYYMSEDDAAIASWTYTLSNSSDYVFYMLLYDSKEIDDIMHFYIRPSLVIQNANSGLFSYNQETVTDEQAELLYTWYVLNYEGSIFGPPTEPEGGEGGGVLQDDPIPEPTKPTLTAIDTGFTRMYWLTNSQLKALATWLLNDGGGSVKQYLFGADLMQAVVGLSISPVNVPHASGTSDINIMGEDTGCNGHLLTDQFFDIDCGTFHFDETMGGNYLDYNPYTMIRVILPYIGSLTLETDDVMKKTIRLKYVFDALSGVCVAHIYVDGSLHYEAAGQYLINVPMTKVDFSQDQAAVKQGIMALAAGAVGMATGGAAALAGSAAMGASAMNVMTSHKHVNYIAGSGGGVGGYMGIDRPFIIIERPITARPEDDELYTGMPSFITGSIGSFSHYVKFKAVHLTGLKATAEEKVDIEQNLLNGVYVESGSATPEYTPTDSADTTIIFLKMTSENNVIGKTFGNAKAIEGKLIYNQSILKPSIAIKGDVIDYNYAYLPLFKRFYYITDVIARNADIEEVQLQCDALQSHAEDIKGCYGIGQRAGGKKTNYYINDDAITVKQNKIIVTKQFTAPNNTRFSFKKNDAGFILVVALSE